MYCHVFVSKLALVILIDLVFSTSAIFFVLYRKWCEALLRLCISFAEKFDYRSTLVVFSFYCYKTIQDRKMEEPQPHLCDICLKTRSQYKCPKCNWKYCSVKCYRDEKHSDCSESFYREEIFLELDSREDGDDLKKVLDEISHLDIGETSSENTDETCSEIIDLDSGNIFDQLSEKQQNAFNELLRTNRGSLIVDLLVPWWRTDESKNTDSCPSMIKSRDLSLILTGSPSSTMVFRSLNVAFVYCFCYRLYNADFSDLADEVAAFLYECTIFGDDKNLNFENTDFCIWSTIYKIQCKSQSHLKMVPIKLLLEDTMIVLKSLENRSAMFSHIFQIIDGWKGGALTKSQSKKAMMSCKFYLSWLDSHHAGPKVWHNLIGELRIFFSNYLTMQYAIPEYILQKLRHNVNSQTSSKIEEL